MKAIVSALLILLVLFSCAACDGYAVMEKYPWYKADNWYCEEIDFAFGYEYDVDGCLKPSVSYPIKSSGETLYVFVGFMSSYWFVELDNGDDLISLEEELMRGTWEYKKGDLVLTITKDNLFNGAYTELVFVAGE